MWSVATRKGLLDTGAVDAHDDHEAKRRNDDTVPMVQELSSGSGVKRSNIAIRRADAEAEKALERARLFSKRRAAKRASATPEEMETMLVAAEAAVTEVRETIGALTVSALQQAHAMSHRAETTAESFFRAHRDMTVTTKEQARKKQLGFLESMKVYEEVYVDACWNTRHVPTHSVSRRLLKVMPSWTNLDNAVTDSCLEGYSCWIVLTSKTQCANGPLTSAQLLLVMKSTSSVC